MNQTKTINVSGTSITVISGRELDYISLTDMIKAKDGDFFVSDWLRNRNTIEFLGIWESINNPHFNYGEFAIIKSLAGLNSYKLSVIEWVGKTNTVFEWKSLAKKLEKYSFTLKLAESTLSTDKQCFTSLSTKKSINVTIKNYAQSFSGKPRSHPTCLRFCSRFRQRAERGNAYIQRSQSQNAAIR